MKNCAKRILWIFALTFLSAAMLNAEGFRNPPPGTFDLGRAGGRIAQVDDSSAVQQNQFKFHFANRPVGQHERSVETAAQFLRFNAVE